MVDRLAQSVNVHVVHAALPLERLSGSATSLQSFYGTFVGTTHVIAAWVAFELKGGGVVPS